ncbi:MAG TPA: hypothetical protein VFY52_05830 [Thermoleophilaceae bacterium]|nr:hypothetical protein [Thermoleophilaceae bacterium]
MGEQCNWCGSEIDPSESWRAREHPGARKAVFCRLEHVVPWAMQGAHWDPAEPGEAEVPRGACAQCGAELGDVRLLLVRHRGEHRIPDAFCSVDHMADWAKSGGRWR